MRFFRRWLSLGTVLLVLSGSFFVAQLVSGGSFGGSVFRSLGIVRESIERTNAASLQEVEEVLQLLAARSLARVVFPYDFLSQDRSVDDLLAKLQSPDQGPDESDRLGLEAISLAQEIGMRLGRDFVVVPLDIRIGFDLGPGLDIREDEDAITLTLPEPRVQGVTVEDFDSEGYPYPVPAVSAEAFSRAAAFVAERAPGRLVETEADTAIDSATRQLKALLAPIAEGREIRILVRNSVSE